MLYALPEGDTRIERMRRTMADWLDGLPQSGIDDLTLITPEGTPVAHTTDPSVSSAALDAYTPQFQRSGPLDSMLVDALGAVSDPMPRPGMRAFLLVFSASKLSQRENIGQGLCPRAAELHAPLYGIWSARTEPSAKADMDALAALASACGGYSVALENSAGPATMLAMIATQRTQYRLDYRSSAASAGQHSLAVSVGGAGFQAESAPLAFTADVQPPAVTWIDFPQRLVRAGSGVSQPVEEYQPAGVDLKAEVTFPDGHPRRIVSMQLFADNQLAAECTQSPCTEVHWDLRGYSQSGAVSLRLAVRDELGLEGQTAATDCGCGRPSPFAGGGVPRPVRIAAEHNPRAGGGGRFAAGGGRQPAPVAGRGRPRARSCSRPPGAPPRRGGRDGKVCGKISAASGGPKRRKQETYAILEPLEPGGQAAGGGRQRRGAGPGPPGGRHGSGRAFGLARPCAHRPDGGRNAVGVRSGIGRGELDQFRGNSAGRRSAAGRRSVEFRPGGVPGAAQAAPESGAGKGKSMKDNGAMLLETAADSNIGLVRTNNEDRFVVMELACGGRSGPAGARGGWSGGPRGRRGGFADRGG